MCAQNGRRSPDMSFWPDAEGPAWKPDPARARREKVGALIASAPLDVDGTAMPKPSRRGPGAVTAGFGCTERALPGAGRLAGTAGLASGPGRTVERAAHDLRTATDRNRSWLTTPKPSWRRRITCSPDVELSLWRRRRGFIPPASFAIQRAHGRGRGEDGNLGGDADDVLDRGEKQIHVDVRRSGTPLPKRSATMLLTLDAHRSWRSASTPAGAMLCATYGGGRHPGWP